MHPALHADLYRLPAARAGVKRGQRLSTSAAWAVPLCKQAGRQAQWKQTRVRVAGGEGREAGRGCTQALGFAVVSATGFLGSGSRRARVPAEGAAGSGARPPRPAVPEESAQPGTQTVLQNTLPKNCALAGPPPARCTPHPNAAVGGGLACVSRVCATGWAMEGMSSNVLVTRPNETSTPVLALRGCKVEGAAGGEARARASPARRRAMREEQERAKRAKRAKRVGKERRRQELGSPAPTPAPLLHRLPRAPGLPLPEAGVGSSSGGSDHAADLCASLGASIALASGNLARKKAIPPALPRYKRHSWSCPCAHLTTLRP